MILRSWSSRTPDARRKLVRNRLRVDERGAIAGSRALGSGVDPRLDQVAEQRLRAGSWVASGARLPAPRHQIIVRQVLVQQRKIAAAIAIGILDLAANLADRLALPRHLDGSIQRGCPGMLRYDARSRSVT